MSDINVEFTRTLLSLVMATVRKVTTAEQRKAAWVYKTDRQSWEFHGPSEFYWWGTADNAYDARAKGWQAWLAKFHPEMEQDQE